MPHGAVVDQIVELFMLVGKGKYLEFATKQRITFYGGHQFHAITHSSNK